MLETINDYISFIVAIIIFIISIKLFFVAINYKNKKRKSEKIDLLFDYEYFED